jgi:antitoxin CptB
MQRFNIGRVDVSENIEHKRVIWHCRRGMLELDVLLLPFGRDSYLTLSVEDQAKFVNLIACEDPDLFGWFMQQSVAENPDHAYMVDMILKVGNTKV